MKILIFTATFQCSENDTRTDFMLNMAHALIKKGHTVKVVGAHTPGVPLSGTIMGVDVERFAYFYPKKYQKLAFGSGMLANMRKSNLAKLQFPTYLVAGTLKFNKVLKEFKPDVVHALWAFPQGFMAAFVRKFKSFPLVINAIGTEVYMAKKLGQQWAIKFAASKADLVTATSSTTAKAVRDCSYSKQIPIIFNGVDTETFKPENDGLRIRKEYSLGKKPVVLSVGRMLERKGQIYLVEAMKKVVERIPNATLVLLGEGPLKQQLQDKSKSLGLEKNILFVGNQGHDRLPFFYSACDVFVIPSITDSAGVAEGGQGLVTKEAMVSKKCVVGTRCGGIPDLVINERTGLLVDQKSSEQLAKALIRLLGNSKLRKKLAENAFKEAMKRASWDGITTAYIKHYDRIVKEYRKRQKG